VTISMTRLTIMTPSLRIANVPQHKQQWAKWHKSNKCGTQLKQPSAKWHPAFHRQIWQSAWRYLVNNTQRSVLQSYVPFILSIILLSVVMLNVAASMSEQATFTFH
jgi:outer membrane receptor for Fe3+-dicitrate